MTTTCKSGTDASLLCDPYLLVTQKGCHSSGGYGEVIGAGVYVTDQAFPSWGEVETLHLLSGYQHDGQQTLSAPCTLVEHLLGQEVSRTFHALLGQY